MPNRIMYRKTLKGRFFNGFVATPIAYTTQATYGAFVQNAAEGEIGVFTGTTGTNQSTWTRATAAWGTGAGAINAGQSFFIAQRILGSDGSNSWNRTPTIAFEDVTSRIRTLYQTPVRQVTYVGFDGGSNSANLPTYVLGSIYDMTVILEETTSGNQPYTDFGSGYATLTGTPSWARAFTDWADAYNANTQPPTNTNVARLAVVDVVSNGTFTGMTVASGNVVFTRGSATVTATGHNLTAGAFIRVDTTAVSPTAATAAAGTLYRVISTTTNAFVLDRNFTGQVTTFGLTTGTETVLNANVGFAVGVMTSMTDFGLRFTAVDFGRRFRAALPEFSQLDGAGINYSVAAVDGQGDPELLQYEEQEAINDRSNQGGFSMPFANYFNKAKTYISQTLGYNYIDISAASYTRHSVAAGVARFVTNITIFTPATSASLAVSPAQTLQNGLSAAAASPHATLTLVFTGAAN